LHNCKDREQQQGGFRKRGNSKGGRVGNRWVGRKKDNAPTTGFLLGCKGKSGSVLGAERGENDSLGGVEKKRTKGRGIFVLTIGFCMGGDVSE